jgi:hypothetical protein
MIDVIKPKVKEPLTTQERQMQDLKIQILLIVGSLVVIVVFFGAFGYFLDGVKTARTDLNAEHIELVAEKLAIEKKNTAKPIQKG